MLRLRKKLSRPPLPLRFYCIYTLLMYTNTACPVEAEKLLEGTDFRNRCFTKLSLIEVDLIVI